MAKKEKEVTQLKDDKSKQIELLKKEMETFKTTNQDLQSQLSQSLEMNDKIISELESKERDVEVFQQVRMSLEKAIEDLQNQNTQLVQEIETFKTEQMKARVSGLAERWVEKYGMSRDKLPEVVNMLTKFQSDEELERFEKLLGLTSKGNVKVSPVPLTKPSTAVEQFTAKTEPNKSELSTSDYMDLLHKRLLLVQQNKQG